MFTFFPVQLTTSRIGNLTRLIHTLLKVLTTHIHTSLLIAISRIVINYGDETVVMKPSCREGGVGINFQQ